MTFTNITITVSVTINIVIVSIGIISNFVHLLYIYHAAVAYTLRFVLSLIFALQITFRFIQGCPHFQFTHVIWKLTYRSEVLIV